MPFLSKTEKCLKNHKDRDLKQIANKKHRKTYNKEFFKMAILDFPKKNVAFKRTKFSDK